MATAELEIPEPSLELLDEKHHQGYFVSLAFFGCGSPLLRPNSKTSPPAPTR
jgi:hypothetical protein